MRKAIAPFGIVILAVLAIAATSSASLAQAGSTGGSVGKTDKSLSGGEEPHAPAISQKPQRPQTHTFWRPLINGIAIDHCAKNSDQWCDDQAATTWCRSKGFLRAIASKFDSVPRAFRLLDMTTCDASSSRLGCGGFTQITCE
jgi:hypothetical protein